MKLLKPKFINSNDPPDSTELYLDRVLLQEPNLITPGKKPLGDVAIDWTHPSTYGLKAGYIFNKVTGNNLIKDITGFGPDIVLATSGTEYSDISVHGGEIGLHNDATKTSYGYIDAGEIPGGGDDVNAIMFGIYGWANSRGVVTIYGPSGGTTDFQVWFGTTGYKAQPHGGDGTDVIAYTSNITYRRIHSLYWQNSSTNKQSFYNYKDGAHAKDTGTVSCTSFPASGRKFLIGTDADSLGTDGDGSLAQYFGGIYFYLFFFNREFEDDEAYSLNENPYQFLIPR
jgi:hypothetical protein